MRWLVRPDIRQRLWIALALLAASTVFVGVIAWTALDRANVRLEQLHRQTLTEVARSLTLSKQSADLATSAPFLLHLNSPYLVEREGQVLLRALEPMLSDWPAADNQPGSPVRDFENSIVAAIRNMRNAVSDLMVSAGHLSRERDATRALNARLADLERRFYAGSTNPDMANVERRVWLALLTMSNDLAGAGRAGNLLGVGEYRRQYQVMRREYASLPGSARFLGELDKLERISHGPDGLFQTRRRELARQMESQNALFRIRYNAGIISDLAAQFAANAEEFLSRERQETATSIGLAKAVIVIAGLGAVTLALVSALFVSNYVTGNIRAISDAMVRLAQGDRRSQLARKPLSDDEIGKLLHSFRVFRANALRLDRSNRQLHLKNALLEKIFTNISDGVAVTSDNGQLTAINPNLQHVLKLDDEALADRPAIMQLLARTIFSAKVESAGIHAGFRGFAELQSPDGQSLEIRCSRLPDGGGIWLFSDATERRRIDERLRQIEQIESLGKVTGEVAHDFGNILSTISANTHLLESGSAKSDRAALFRGISNAVEIGTSLTQRLLAFARKQRLAPEVVELNELVDGLTDLVSIGLKEGVELEASLSGKRLHVRADPGQLESAILNLCMNGAQAIAASGRVHITVSEQDGEKAVIEVRDNGCGMSNAVLKRSLEPFFSARPDGEGTGLGLSMVYGFIKQTGGDIQIFSKPGEGTSVRLELPLCRNIAAMPEWRAETARVVLVVEDEAQALADVSDMLGGLGYGVVRAKTFEQADRALKSGRNFHALVTDLHLDQGRTGWALARTCLATSSDARIIVASGRMPDVHPFSDQSEPRVTCLAKPLSSAGLRQALH